MQPDAIELIPQPLRCEPLDAEEFVLGPRLVILVGDSPDEMSVGVLAGDLLGRLTHRAVEVRGHGGAVRGEDVLVLRVTPDAQVPAPESTPEADRAATAAQSYRLEVGPGRAQVSAPTTEGLLAGFLTFQQLLRPGPDGLLRARAVRVEDVPRYRWRGLSLDIARSFFTPDEIKVVISLMAHYKLNMLHLHLTDDQAWRLETPSRPRLVEEAAEGAVTGGRGGRLTVADLRDLTSYASARGVTLVPEIDLPGHVNAALRAYPELNPSGEAPPRHVGLEVGFSRLTAALPATQGFVEDVLTDAAQLTAGPYLHLGGDEVLTMERAEYTELIEAAAKVVQATGKTVVGWQEAAGVPLPPGAIVQLWDTRPDLQAVRDAVASGARLLMSPGSRVYLDMKYDASTELGLEWAGHIELRDAYDWEPSTLVEGVDPGAVIGVEAAVWSETLHDLDSLLRMLLPRLAAVAEVAWSVPERRSWEGFRARVAHQPVFWERAGFPWHPSPQVDWAL
ncbi:family 20 glycosylhydrolase [Cellulomonas cellasea]|uniref:family 20 glycosylhydrolase n=1 Tax=Cellulomonas cellasea TaxID=43670 RepID=UPI0025A320BD|nr:family 20 glycosylhydrolase [Cellulomonas cellasea]MDM8083285.1 family 20 glycosylhydrolase [Cellulomonas cellasea]